MSSLARNIYCRLSLAVIMLINELIAVEYEITPIIIRTMPKACSAVV